MIAILKHGNVTAMSRLLFCAVTADDSSALFVSLAGPGAVSGNCDNRG
jgi:hypothetical protein